MARLKTRSQDELATASFGVSDTEGLRAILTALLENSADAQLAVDEKGIIRYANRQAEQLFGVARDALLGEPIDMLVAAEKRAVHAGFVRKYFGGQRARLMGDGREFQAVDARGDVIPVEIGLAPFEVSGAKLVMCSVRDIRRRLQMRDALQLSETRSHEVQRIAKIGNWDWNLRSNQLWWSDEIYRMFGTEPQSFGCTYEDFLGYVHAEDRDKVSAAVERAIEHLEPYSIRHRIVLADGTEKVVHEKAEVLLDRDGAIRRMVGTVQDVTDYKRIEEEVVRSEARLREAEQIAKVGSWEWNVVDGSIWWSDGLYAILEESRESLESSFENFLQRVHPEDRASVVHQRDAVHDASIRQQPHEFRLVLADGRVKFVARRTEVRRDEDGRALSLIGTIQDITERKAAEARVQYLATHDEMTGLPNRLMFDELLRQSLRSSARYERRGAVLFIDLDGFKYINDSLGHSAGDELLRVIGERLEGVLRQSDCAARLGGDEFCILAENIGDESGASTLAQKCLDVIGEPVAVAGRELRPRASIGITLFPDDGHECQTLMKAADSAMYAAKQDSQRRYQFYSQELTARAERRMALEHDLRRSIQMGDFLLHYQPQIDLARGQMLSTEALIRWQHPRRGLIAPGEFIDIAEKTGLIEELGEWALRTAIHDLMSWNAARPDPLRVAVNISSQHFRDGRIVDSVARALDATGLDPDLLEIEVTETVTQASEETIGTFYGLRDLGVHIAIDDFGTGYSCLESLRQLPIDTLKIDKRFIHDLLGSPEMPAIIGTIVAMGRAMRLKVIAEGVETIDQVQYLCALGCESAQGYYFSKPVTSAEIAAIGNRNFLPAVDSEDSPARPASAG